MLLQDSLLLLRINFWNMIAMKIAKQITGEITHAYTKAQSR